MILVKLKMKFRQGNIYIFSSLCFLFRFFYLSPLVSFKTTLLAWYSFPLQFYSRLLSRRSFSQCFPITHFHHIYNISFVLVTVQFVAALRYTPRHKPSPPYSTCFFLINAHYYYQYFSFPHFQRPTLFRLFPSLI